MKFLQSLPFKRRVFLGCFLIAMVPLLLCSTLTVRLFSVAMRQRALEHGRRQMLELVDHFDSVLQDADRVLTHLSQSTLFQRALTDRSGNLPDTAVCMALYRAAANVRGNIRFALYDAGGVCRYATQVGTQDQRLSPRRGILRKAATGAGTVYLSDPLPGRGGPESISLCAARAMLSQSGPCVGYAEFSITQAQMQQIFPTSSFSPGALFIFTPQGHLLYTSTSSGEEDANAIRAQMLNGAAFDNGDNFLFFHRDARFGCVLALRQPALPEHIATSAVCGICAACAAVCVVSCAIVSLLFSRNLSIPISRLNNAMQQAHAGNLSARIPTARQDEIGLLAKGFNALAERLQRCVSEQEQWQKALAEARVRQLQAQLNPHFLYNTLDTMKWIAKIHHLPQVAGMACGLAGILRYSVSGDQLITLQQELTLLDRYIEIQRIRFPGKFQYLVDIPASLRSCTIPKLILQPLVENSILHGLANSHNGLICIRGHCSGGVLTLCVCDNGCGIAPDMLRRLNAAEPQIQKGHLGLSHVNYILKLYYGQPYGLHVTGQPGAGTTVSIRLPAVKGAQHVENCCGGR